MHHVLSTFHTSMTWILGFTIVLVYAWMILGIFMKQAYGAWTQRIMLVFGGLLTVQWLVGISVFVTRGEFDRWQFWSHASVMTLAVALVLWHLRRQPSGQQKQYWASLGVISGALFLVLVGIVLLFVG